MGGKKIEKCKQGGNCTRRMTGETNKKHGNAVAQPARKEIKV
jgi:hypothetical protein